MILSDVAIRRPVFTAIIAIALMTLGILGANSLGVDLFPDVEFPIVSIVTAYPGAGPEEVEQLVTKPIEEVVSSINGVDEVRSYSRDSVSTVVIVFKLEVDVKAAATDVREKIAAIRSTLPKDMKDPMIQRIDPTAISVLTYAVSSSRGAAETRRITEFDIKPRIESVDGVASVSLVGGLEREVHIYLQHERLEALGLSLAQLAQQVGAESYDLPGGRITDGATELNVRTLGRFRSIEELSDMVVVSLANGSQVKLQDIARIEDGYKEVRSKAFLDGKPAVTFEVQKQAGTNTVAVADAVYKRVAELEKTLPKDVKISKAVDTSSFIRSTISGVTEALVVGGLMAIFVIFIFMLDWRSTLISSLALPTSVVTTFFVMYWMHFTFNMMSMMGLSLAIGLLIDDAVVVRENIYRHMERGEDPVTAAQRGTSEIGLAVLATTLTIVAVFVPVAFMGGIVGRMFRQFGLTVAAAVLVSLFISFTLDPMMSARIVKPVTKGHHGEMRAHRIYGPIVRSYDWLDDFYRRMLSWSLRHKKLVVLSAVGLFIGTMALVPLMGTEFQPLSDRGEFAANLEMPPGTSLAEMERVTQDIEKIIRQNPEIRMLFTVIGPREEANKATIRVYTSNKSARHVTVWQIQEQLRAQIGHRPNLRLVMTDPNFFGGAMEQERLITIYIRGDNYETLQRFAGESFEVLKQVRGVKEPDMSYRPGLPETSIRVDRERAADLGVSVGTIAQTIRLGVEGEVVAKFRQGDRDWDVRAQLAPEDRKNGLMLAKLTVPATGRRVGSSNTSVGAPGAAGPRLVRLGEVAEVAGSTGPATIERMNRQRQIVLSASLVDRSLGEAVSDIQKGFKKLKRPSDVTVVFGGQTKNMNETFSNMALALLVAVLFIYFVLASQFESVIHPLTIMFTLPLAMVGALLSLFVLGLPISMMAMIGIILLMGLVTKNAILLVDYTNELRARGKSMIEALLEAGPTRLRPILMTSAAMVLGMLPSALSRSEGSEMRMPMAVVVIAGVITSTLLTLVVVPIMYTWLDRFTLKHRSAATVDPFRKEAELASQPGEGMPQVGKKDLP